MFGRVITEFGTGFKCLSIFLQSIILPLFNKFIKYQTLTKNGEFYVPDDIYINDKFSFIILVF